jgi:hypothetical protein
VSSVGEDFKRRLPKLVANITLALTFGAMGIFFSRVLASVGEGFGFYYWLVLTLVGGAFLVRGLFDLLTVGDKTVGLFMTRLGIQHQSSRRRIAKDSVFIVATILATAAILPVLRNLGPVGTVLQSVTTIVAIGAIFLFVYDTARVVNKMFHEKAGAVADWLELKQTQETK